MNENIQRVIIVAEGLGNLLDQTAFIGGSVVGLYADDSGGAEVRPTLDVDCVVELASLSNYYTLEETLRGKGFRNDVAGGVICRWLYHGISVDIMPVHSDFLGFSNPWYAVGMKTIVGHMLPNGLSINVFSAPVFLATKLEAFRSRGEDLRYDADFEDIVFLFNNRRQIVEEIRAEEDQPMKAFIVNQVAGILTVSYLAEAVGCALGTDLHRTELVLSKLLQVSRFLDQP